MYPEIAIRELVANSLIHQDFSVTGSGPMIEIFSDRMDEHLANHGWLYADGDASRYDRARALFPEDVLAWLKESQPDAWEAATKSHGVNAGEVIISRSSRRSSITETQTSKSARFSSSV